MSEAKPETKSAVISISKALLGVSFSAIAALGGASGISWIAAATAVPGATLNAVDSLGPVLQKFKGKKEEILEIPMPPWWSRREDASWQEVCTSVESQLPAIMNATAEELKREALAHIPTTSAILRVFTNQIERRIPTWDININERGIIAAHIAGPFLDGVSVVFRAEFDSIQKDALALKVEEIAEAVAKLAAAAQTSQGTSSPVVMTPSAQGMPTPADMLCQKWQTGAYDVYICYHKDDVAVVKGIDQKLKAEGVLPWFDMRKEPGIPEQTQQDEQIRKISSVAVFIGKHALSDWQTMEVQALIREFVNRKFMRVIPVYLPDAPLSPELSVFLENFTGVDFRQSDPDPFAYLMWGITGQRPPIV